MNMSKGTISFDGKQFTLVMEGKKSKFIKWREFPGLVDPVGTSTRECEYEATPSTITCITLDGRKFENETLAQGSRLADSQLPTPLVPSTDALFAALQQRPHHSGREIREHRAGAPYNFVPLNAELVQFEGPPDLDRFHRHPYLSGFVSLDIKTLTPLYIRGRSKDESHFFSPAGRPCIPGSSLRGMVRTLLEIATYGTFLQTDLDRHIYYRSVAEEGGRNKKYRKIISRTKAGFLKFDANRREYIIRQAPLIEGKDTFKKIKTDGDDRPFTLVCNSNDAGMVLISGHIEKKQHKYRIKFPSDEKNSFTLAQDDVDIYRNDTNREDGDWILLKDNISYALGTQENPSVSLLNMATMHEVFPHGVPCFFVNEKVGVGERVLFGHTPNFRIPYQSSIKTHINPKALLDESITDACHAIFGKLGHWAGRVFFEDAVLRDGQTNIFMGETVPGILLSPKPSTYQHYLTQGTGGLQTWDGSSPLRGYKLYWHRMTNFAENDPRKYYGWKGFALPSGKPAGKVRTVINPVRPEVRFSGRIRFDNLSRMELGALLFVLDLPANCHHKLGMGKALGLGSLAITPKVTLIDRRDRYKQLFDKLGWALSTTEPDITTYRKTFEECMLDTINGDEFSSFWDIPRMNLLRAMLTWKEGKMDSVRWLEGTRPMEIELQVSGKEGSINEYGKRHVLPDPLDVLKNLD